MYALPCYVIDEIPSSSNDNDSALADKTTEKIISSSSSSTLSRAIFKVPEHLATLLIAQPVVCRGGSFELKVYVCTSKDTLHALSETATGEINSTVHSRRSSDLNNGDSVNYSYIFTEFYSPYPTETANAISQRLLCRMNDPNPPGAEDACNIS